eukprot:14562950-Alexandrium_andersonii.AAC.1
MGADPEQGQPNNETTSPTGQGAPSRASTARGRANQAARTQQQAEARKPNGPERQRPHSGCLLYTSPSPRD